MVLGLPISVILWSFVVFVVLILVGFVILTFGICVLLFCLVCCGLCICVELDALFLWGLV